MIHTANHLGARRIAHEQGATLIETLVAFSLFATFALGSFETQRAAHRMHALTVLESRENAAVRQLLIASPEALAELSNQSGRADFDFSALQIHVECVRTDESFSRCTLTPTTDAERALLRLGPVKPISLSVLVEK